jgi:hypothetical protein
MRERRKKSNPRISRINANFLEPLAELATKERKDRSAAEPHPNLAKLLECAQDFIAACEQFPLLQYRNLKNKHPGFLPEFFSRQFA